MQFVEAHGARIPTIGLAHDLEGGRLRPSGKGRLQIGYRHLDTAAFYGNEKENGEGLRASGVKREDVFICTKVRENKSAAGKTSTNPSTKALANLQFALCGPRPDPLEQ